MTCVSSIVALGLGLAGAPEPEPSGPDPVDAARSDEASPEPTPTPAAEPMPVEPVAEVPAVVAPEVVDAAPPALADKKKSEIASFEFGKGLTVRSKDDRFSLTIRGRVQLRFSVEHDGTDLETPTDLLFQVRRARLLFTGNFLNKKLQYYVQLGMAPLDMEADLLVPVRDAYITYLALRDLNLRAGQMKVPFNRERVISSSALQMVDRSIVNAELSLDRDVGLQLFSNDLFGLGGRLGYQLGVYGGEGRNRWGEGTGLLYVARLQVQPLGEFEDSYVESDIVHDKRARLSLGGGFAYNDDAYRERSTHGTFYEAGTFDTLHAEADLIFKAAGFSFMSEFVWRKTVPESRSDVDSEGAPIDVSGRSGLGWMAQTGYLHKTGIEVSARWAELRPIEEVATALTLSREGAVGLGYYFMGHDLKLQADYAVSFGIDPSELRHTGRVHTQVYF